MAAVVLLVGVHKTAPFASDWSEWALHCRLKTAGKILSQELTQIRFHYCDVRASPLWKYQLKMNKRLYFCWVL